MYLRGGVWERDQHPRIVVVDPKLIVNVLRTNPKPHEPSSRGAQSRATTAARSVGHLSSAAFEVGGHTVP